MKGTTLDTQRLQTGRLVRPDILVSAQDEWYTQPAGAAIAGPNSVITISGPFFLQIGGLNTPDYAAWKTRTQTQVENRLQTYLNNHPTIDPNTTGIVIMDHEDPHPANLHYAYGTTNYATEAEQDEQIAGFKLRIAAARVKFPKAKLAVYGVFVPEGRGRDLDNELANKAALVRAGRLGMFDGIDYLCPVLYPRFGPSDGVNFWSSEVTRAYTDQGLRYTRAILKSDNSIITALPLLTVKIANGNSIDNDDMVLDLVDPDPMEKTLRTQLRWFALHGVKKVVLWVGNNVDPLDVAGAPNPHGFTLAQHINAMGVS